MRIATMRVWLRVAATLAFASASALVAGSQSGGSSPLPSFEVASIKLNRSQSLAGSLGWRGDMFRAKNISTRSVIEYAFHIWPFQLSSGPAWMKSANYDIEAKMDESVANSLEKLPSNQRQKQMRMMVESLLADRFNLKVRRETRELPVYALVVAKGGPKLSELAPGDTSQTGVKARDGRTYPGPLLSVLWEYTQIRGGWSSMGSLAGLLSQQLGRTVLDRTRLKGKYDYTLRWTRDEYQDGIVGLAAGEPGLKPAADADSSPPSIFTAIHEQLGLRLESTKGPVEVVVIDHIERPSEN